MCRAVSPIHFAGGYDPGYEEALLAFDRAVFPWLTVSRAHPSRRRRGSRVALFATAGCPLEVVGYAVFSFGARGLMTIHWLAGPGRGRQILWALNGLFGARAMEVRAACFSPQSGF